MRYYETVGLKEMPYSRGDAHYESMTAAEVDVSSWTASQDHGPASPSRQGLQRLAFRVLDLDQINDPRCCTIRPCKRVAHQNWWNADSRRMNQLFQTRLVLQHNRSERESLKNIRLNRPS